MVKIKFKERTGKDLFEFMARSVIDSKLALNWAIEEFVLVDEKNLEVRDIARLTDKAYLLISSKVFSMSTDNIEEDNQGIHYQDYCIKSKKISRDFVTELQTEVQQNSKNQVQLLQKCILKFFDVTLDALEEMPYLVVVYLVHKVNFFLSELATDRDELELDDVWDSDT